MDNCKKSPNCRLCLQKCNTNAFDIFDEKYTLKTKVSSIFQSHESWEKKDTQTKPKSQRHCKFGTHKNSYRCYIHEFGDEKSTKFLKVFCDNEVSYDVRFSSKICPNCFRIIEEFWLFYENVLTNQKLLQNETKVVYEVEYELNKVYNTINQSTTDLRIKLVSELTNKSNPPDPIEAELPSHLKVRMTKEKGDAKIREFIELKCEICENITFETFKCLQDHYMDIHDLKGYVICCDKKIYRKDRLMNHIINHINPNAFTCPKCGQTSKSKILLKIHMKQHLPVEDRQHQCEKCQQRFVLRSQLTNHEASHLNDAQKKFVCEICGKAFALKFVMIKHMQIHSRRREFVCEICAKSFATNSNLQAHKVSHADTPQPRVQCSVCQSWYKNADTLRSHMRRHRSSNCHECPECDKTCSTATGLAAHIRYVHSQVREFECNLCNRKFRRKLELREHQARKHTGKSLYQCQYCSKTFKSSSNYFYHRKHRHTAAEKMAVNEQQSEIDDHGETTVVQDHIDNNIDIILF